MASGGGCEILGPHSSMYEDLNVKLCWLVNCYQYLMELYHHGHVQESYASWTACRTQTLVDFITVQYFLP